MTFKALNDLALAQSLWPHIFTSPHKHPINPGYTKTTCNSSKESILGPRISIYVLLSSSLESPLFFSSAGIPLFLIDTTQKSHPPTSRLKSPLFLTKLG